ncbi:Rv3235 family protein [Streptomyces sp. NPDC003077]|uniref:Rv3235 family protein n=1 Tax=Streptomyces sp. NPDC003077 TaxID=3154443 RepID=UPI0033A22D1B
MTGTTTIETTTTALPGTDPGPTTTKDAAAATAPTTTRPSQGRTPPRRPGHATRPTARPSRGAPPGRQDTRRPGGPRTPSATGPAPTAPAALAPPAASPAAPSAIPPAAPPVRPAPAPSPVPTLAPAPPAAPTRAPQVPRVPAPRPVPIRTPRPVPGTTPVRTPRPVPRPARRPLTGPAIAADALRRTRGREPHMWFAHQLLLTLSGQRPVHTLLGHALPEAYDRLVELAPRAPLRPLGRHGRAPAPAVQDCGRFLPHRGAIEAFARIASGDRLRALAFRLELGGDARWRCAAVDIGPTVGVWQP